MSQPEFVIINSTYRQIRASFNPITVPLSKAIPGGTYEVSLVSATVPPAFNQIQSGYDSYMAFSVGATTYSGNIPGEAFSPTATVADILSTIQTYMNSFPHAQTFTLTYQSVSNRVEISSTAPFILLADDKPTISIYSILGFNEYIQYPSDVGNTITAPAQFNAYKDNYFLIDILEFSGGIIQSSNSAANFVVPFRENSNPVIFTEQSDYVQTELITIPTLNQLSATLTYANGYPVEMQADWNFVLRIRKL